MKKIIIFALGAILFPFTVSAQTSWAYTERFAQENKEVAVRPKAVFMGDSITQCWPDSDPSFFPDNNFLCRGISGQTSAHMLCRFRNDVVELNPKYVVILAGTNDIALNNGPISVEDIFRNIVSMCEIAKANKIKPVLCSVLPCKGYHWRPEVTDAPEQIIKLNAMMKKYADENKFIYVDYHSALKDDENGLPEKYTYDGCHTTLEGYKVMERLILNALK